MRFGRLNDRLVLLGETHALDVHKMSGGRFAADPDLAFEDWDSLVDWAQDQSPDDGIEYAAEQLGAPFLRPPQIFAIGLNYVDHAKESGVTVPSSPTVFTKFATCLTGPYSEVVLPTDGVDWEVELVVVLKKQAERVSVEDAWSYVAGLMVGQDLSERATQLAGPVPQFSLGKSFPGFGPIGPALVTLDEVESPDDLAITYSLDGEVLQAARTSQMVFSVPELISRISHICPLLPGDLIFTGTPPGVGMGRDPKRYLPAGGTLTSEIKGIGKLVNTMTAASVAS